MTKIVHMKREHFDVSIARPSRFGNPFKIGRDGTREEVISKYHLWFYARLAAEPDFRRAVELLAGRTLGCWCRPLACHGDVIAEYLDNPPAAAPRRDGA